MDPGWWEEEEEEEEEDWQKLGSLELQEESLLYPF